MAELAISDAIKTRPDALTRSRIDACGDKLIALVVHGALQAARCSPLSYRPGSPG